MFDMSVSRLAESISGFFGDKAKEALGHTGELSGLVSSLGLSPQALSELAPEQVLELLSQSGIDWQQLAPEDLQQLFSSLGMSDRLTELIGK